MSRGHLDLAGGLEDGGQQLLRLARPLGVGGETGGEIGLGVGERDAQGVQDGLVGWVVVAEVGGERGGLDGGALRELRAARRRRGVAPLRRRGRLSSASPRSAMLIFAPPAQQERRTHDARSRR